MAVPSAWNADATATLGNRPASNAHCRISRGCEVFEGAVESNELVVGEQGLHERASIPQANDDLETVFAYTLPRGGRPKDREHR